MVRHITCTMSNRAPVNRATVERLEKAWNKPITSVYCHWHPLETISRSILGCLTKSENDVVFDKLFSEGSLADKVILAIDKFIFSDSSGDPKGFIAFLVRNNLPCGLIVRTRAIDCTLKVKKRRNHSTAHRSASRVLQRHHA